MRDECVEGRKGLRAPYPKLLNILGKKRVDQKDERTGQLNLQRTRIAIVALESGSTRERTPCAPAKRLYG